MVWSNGSSSSRDSHSLCRSGRKFGLPQSIFFVQSCWIRTWGVILLGDYMINPPHSDKTWLLLYMVIAQGIRGAVPLQSQSRYHWISASLHQPGFLALWLGIWWLEFYNSWLLALWPQIIRCSPIRSRRLLASCILERLIKQLST